MEVSKNHVEFLELDHKFELFDFAIVKESFIDSNFGSFAEKSKNEKPQVLKELKVTASINNSMRG